mgnify:CR=1 FL=1
MPVPTYVGINSIGIQTYVVKILWISASLPPRRRVAGMTIKGLFPFCYFFAPGGDGFVVLGGLVPEVGVIQFSVMSALFH